MSEFIPLCVPNLDEKELEYVTKAVGDGWVSTAGPFVDEFEKKFAKYVGAKHAISTVNGTAAIHVSLILAGVKEGDEVLVPNLTFIAPVNAVRYCFANPVFMDSDWSTLGLDVQKLTSFLEDETYFENGLTYNKKTKAIIRAIVPMHTFGHPVDMDPLVKLCSERNIKIVEDASESLGSCYKGKHTGNFGLLGCFSFNGNKIMTTGGGGMIVTDNDELAKRAKHIATTAKTDPEFYEHDEVGFNYRMVNVLSGIGLGQLEKMDRFIEAKKRIHKAYQEGLKDVEGYNVHSASNDVESNFWLNTLVCDHELDLKKAVDHFKDRGIMVRPVWQLMNKLKMFEAFQSYKCETSQDIYNRSISIPSSTSLTEEHLQRVVSAIKELESNG